METLYKNTKLNEKPKKAKQLFQASQRIQRTL